VQPSGAKRSSWHEEDFVVACVTEQADESSLEEHIQSGKTYIAKNDGWL
jgi:hypothetical protein